MNALKALMTVMISLNSKKLLRLATILCLHTRLFATILQDIRTITVSKWPKTLCVSFVAEVATTHRLAELRMLLLAVTLNVTNIMSSFAKCETTHFLIYALDHFTP